MRCPQCVAEGEKSTLHMAGGGVVTDMVVHQFYDEEGKHHYHDPNGMAESGRCSRGHNLVRIHSTECRAPGCSFGDPEVFKVLSPRPENMLY